jgi:phage host-nuclease inhibitor protein Gam
MTARPRRKAPKLQAPQTIEEATALLGEYADALTLSEQLRAEADRAIAAIQAARDEQLQPLEERMKDRFRQIRAWWAVAGDEITEGKRKSVEIAGCVIGARTTTPKLELGNRKAEDIIADLILFDLNDYLRVKRDLDRQAILRVLAADPEKDIDAGNDQQALLTLGLRRSQKDEFFIDRAASKPAQTEQVATEEAGL